MTAPFGSIRFDEDSNPAKFVRLLPSAEVEMVTDLLLITWSLPPPYAIISIFPSPHTSHYKQDVISQKLDLVMRRGASPDARPVHTRQRPRNARKGPTALCFSTTHCGHTCPQRGAPLARPTLHR